MPTEQYASLMATQIAVHVILALVIQAGFQISVDGKCNITIAKLRNEAQHCKPPWLVWGNHCYLSIALGSSYYNFYDAEHSCQRFVQPGGGEVHLAWVTSGEENQFLRLYATTAGNPGFWIGYQFVTTRFSWVDGTTEIGYENWADGGYAAGGGRCVAVWGGLWYSSWCSNANGFVCKMAIAQY